MITVHPNFSLLAIPVWMDVHLASMIVIYKPPHVRSVTTQYFSRELLSDGEPFLGHKETCLPILPHVSVLSSGAPVIPRWECPVLTLLLPLYSSFMLNAGLLSALDIEAAQTTKCARRNDTPPREPGTKFAKTHARPCM